MATIPFASIEEVEKRLGYELTADEVASVESFLDDFSLLITSAFLQKKKDIDELDPRLLTMVVARRAASYVLTADLLPGQTAFSETVGDRSISGSVSGSASYASAMQLSPNELKLLGLGSRASIYSIEMISPDDYRRYYGHQ